jgi:hypothetical protein
MAPGAAAGARTRRIPEPGLGCSLPMAQAADRLEEHDGASEWRT